MLLCYVLFWFVPSRGNPDLVLNRKMFEPALQPRPNDDMADFSEAQEDLLHSYGWVDRVAGKVHIPIEQAMESALKKNFPARGSH